MLSDRVEKTLNKAFELAADNEHEYATLEHLLLALIDDEDANEVLLSCNVDIEELRAVLNDFITNETSYYMLVFSDNSFLKYYFFSSDASQFKNFY